MQIETERLVLRTPSLEDADDLLDFVGDPDVMRWIGGEAGDRDAAVATIERWLSRWAADGIGHFSVVRDDHVIGRVGFLVWDSRLWEASSYAEADGAAETELGWTMAQKHWGHGYATEAALAARDWAYGERGVDRIISLIAPDNARSIRVAEKLGAAREETISTFHGPATVWVHPR
jgi:RimJ/RimL family protein N-acetyltransferase